MSDERDIWTVSRLNREARMLLETGMRTVWLEGEMSNLAQPASGHIYFSLKDGSAQVRCAMFKSRRMLVKFRPADGNQVLVRGRVSLYEARGDYQFIVDHMEEAGFGALQRAFEALKQKLAAEGLFDEAIKRPLPSMPTCIGVITSPSGAAIRDVISVLARRFPAVRVVVYPVPVQGEGAAERLVAALGTAAARNEVDVLLVVRGGGSMEDLWAFNDEGLARAIRACPIPVVSGVGHEIDFTIADFAADRRAPTPSAAAEMVVPDQLDWWRRIQTKSDALTRALRGRLGRDADRTRWLVSRLNLLHPGRRLQQDTQRLDDIERRLHRAWNLGHERLVTRLAGASRALHAVSPLSTLARGYAIVTPSGSPTPVTDASSLSCGQVLDARFGKGRAELEVKNIKGEDE